MDILHWFNLYDAGHVKAWAIHQSFGHWPEGFIPEGMEFPTPNWRHVIESRMADQYIKAIIGCTPDQIDSDVQTDSVPQDTIDHADTVSVKYGDIFFIPNEGIGIGGIYSHTDRQQEYTIRKEKLAGQKLSHRDKGFWLHQNEVLGLAAEIRARQTMVSLRGRSRVRTYDGFDTVRGVDRGPCGADDQFKIDISESTISVGVVQSTGTWLNASAVKHDSYITIHVHGPNGQPLVTVSLSFEQFAAMLCSNQAQACTVEHYWSIPPEAVRLTEKVKPPQSIKDRMEKRLWRTLEDGNDNLQEIIDTVQEVVDGTSKIGKRKAEDLVRSLKRALDHRQNNANFVVQQALEETTGIVESAAIYLAAVHGQPGASQRIIEAVDPKLIEQK